MRRFLVMTVCALFAMVGGSACLFAVPRWGGPVSDHFDGDQFRNPQAEPGFTDLVRWQLQRDHAVWPDHVDAVPGPPPPRAVPPGNMRVTFINHATTLVQVDGVNILTDPIWSERCSPVSFVGPKRVRIPGIRFEDLPPIHVVLISHNHYDHMDLPTLRRLEETHHPLVLVGLGNGGFLRDNGLQHVRELDWWHHTPAPLDVVIHAVPNQHFSGRGLTDRQGALWTAYVVESPRGGSFYFAGDTGYGPHFAAVQKRFPSLRLAILPIGAYRPEWFMGAVHVSPSQALQAHRDLGAATSVAMHFGTFDLADDGVTEAPDVLLKLLAEQPEPKPRFWVLGFGEGRDVP